MSVLANSSLQIYNFLVSLPADEATLASIENPSTSYKDMFPLGLGQPFKALYAVYALRGYVIIQKRNCDAELLENYLQKPEGVSCPYPAALCKAMSLVVGAVLDEQVIGQYSSQKMRDDLSYSLIETLLSLLRGKFILHPH